MYYQERRALKKKANPYFLEQFQVHNKSEQKYRVPTPLPLPRTASPVITSHAEGHVWCKRGTCANTVLLLLKVQFALGLTLR